MKVKPFKILKPNPHSLVVEVYCDTIFYNQLHQHEEIQISYIVGGHGRLIVGDSIHSYVSGDILVLGSNIPHLFQSTESSTPSHMISVFFTKEGFGEVFGVIPELSEINVFFETSVKGLKIRSLDNDLKQLFLDLPTTHNLQRFILFLKLIQNLKQTESQPLISTLPARLLSNAQGQRLQLIFEYLMNHFHSPIKLKQIAGIVHMTPHSFCRFFKQRTNKTFFQFLIELRIENACQLLLYSPMPTIAEISERSGFNSLSHFNRTFKKIKMMTPSEFAQKDSLEKL